MDEKKNIQVNPNAAAIVSCAIHQSLIETLTSKGLISEEEGLQIYKTAISKMGIPAQQEEAKEVLKALMPGA